MLTTANYVEFAVCGGLMLAPYLIVAQVDEALYRRHTALLFEAMRLSDLTKEKACQWMAIDKNQFRRQSEEQDGHISLTRLMLLPPLFWQFYALLLAEEFGLPKVVTRGVRVMLAMKSRRQLRMVAEPVSAERRMA